MNKMLCLHPCGNLITNVGCGVSGTHCKVAINNGWANLPYKLLPNNLRYLDDVAINKESQNEIIAKMYAPSLIARILSRVRRIVRAVK
jgi:hypothetical protein